MNINWLRTRPACVLLSILFLVLVIIWLQKMQKVSYKISHTWDGQDVDHRPVEVTLEPCLEGMKMSVYAPFFGDPKNPSGPRSQPFQQLWDYEVVEAFFFNDGDQYLEVELCPHGQHLLLLLKGRRKMVKDMLPLTFTAAVNGRDWRGEAIIPASYFPPSVVKFNAYAIHGSGDKRVYESLYPVAQNEFTDPDFHRLEYFRPIDIGKLLTATSTLSKEWENIS